MSSCPLNPKSLVSIYYNAFQLFLRSEEGGKNQIMQISQSRITSESHVSVCSKFIIYIFIFLQFSQPQTHNSSIISPHFIEHPRNLDFFFPE